MLLYISNCKLLSDQSWFGNHLIRLLDSGLLIAVCLSDIYGSRAAVFPYITHYRSDLVSGHLFFKTFIFWMPHTKEMLRYKSKKRYLQARLWKACVVFSVLILIIWFFPFMYLDHKLPKSCLPFVYLLTLISMVSHLLSWYCWWSWPGSL